MNNKNNYQLPKPDTSDWAHTLAKVVLSTVPLVGGPAAELFGMIITPSLAKRRKAWILEITEGLKTLEQRFDEFKIENLIGNESFVTTLLQATQAALRDHKKEKILNLRNAILNTALPNAPKEFWREKFISIIDNLTPWHIRMLAFLDNPYEYCHKNHIKTTDTNGKLNLEQIGQQLFSDLTDNKWSYFKLLFGELNTYKLTTQDYFNDIFDKDSNFFPNDSFSSGLGKDLLRFISSPID